jgi:hypothetical protein
MSKSNAKTRARAAEPAAPSGAIALPPEGGKAVGLAALLSLSDALASTTPLPASERPARPEHLARVGLELAARARWATVAPRLADIGESLLPAGTVDRLERACRAVQHLLDPAVEPTLARVPPAVLAEAEGIDERLGRLLGHWFYGDPEAGSAAGPGGTGYAKLGERLASKHGFLAPHEARLSKDEVAYRASDFERAPVLASTLAAVAASPSVPRREAWQDELDRVLRLLVEDAVLLRAALVFVLLRVPGAPPVPRLRPKRKVKPKAKGDAKAKGEAKAEAEATAKADPKAPTPDAPPPVASPAPIAAPGTAPVVEATGAPPVPAAPTPDAPAAPGGLAPPAPPARPATG